MEHRTLRVDLGQRAYDILIGRGLMKGAGRLILEAAPVAPVAPAAPAAPAARRALVLTDENVAGLYAPALMRSLGEAGCAAALHTVPAGERSKSLECLGEVYAALAAHGITRSDLLIALGGGVVGDLTGFAAATYLRGIRYAQVPTTLLAQVDSAVGGKTAIDLPAGKNLAGAFHQPAAAVIDPDALTTLPERVFVDGMAEVLKYALAFDAGLLAPVGRTRAHAQAHMDEIVHRCLDLKRGVVERDERDTGERMLLNFGHTLGHAVESAERYAGHTHGEAVAIGMRLITRLSECAGLTRPGTAAAIEELLAAWGLPTSCPRSLWPAMRAALLKDKKHLDGALNAVVLTRVGEARITRLPHDFFEGVTEWLA